ncbi:glucans biosynthesis glucosyltransferase MdoH [Methylobacterium sp. Leaf108]|uniref:glucans biosynthesis glucosyltransferase MdoH n=1 Tax=Methylobacterium sp. Leaf108 TaxID=1736256 RepID=UPI0009E78CB6|nr:glucans biosynthesis glucosyltransferase MdoH [Methylobacterium sp. Leaf108]
MAVPLDTLTPPHSDADRHPAPPPEAGPARPTEATSAVPPEAHHAMPPEAPLAMPVQDLGAWDPRSGHRPARPERRPWLARAFVFGGAALLTAYGALQMYEVVSVSGGTTALQYVLLVLFTLNFSWIALAFTGAILGFVVLLRAPRHKPLAGALATRTAVVMPVYNEATARTFAGIEAMRAEVEATGHGAAFDWFVLSDSTQGDAWIAEERAFLALRERLGPEARLYYRHRAKNHHRKAGNIGDFVSRWGASYDHMLVLDADSLMSGPCIVALASAMEADPDAGIVQSLPLIINRNTLFARVQQFAARIYGPVIATGLSAWSGSDGNYWGHNAIIRTRAFAQACGLPDLPGKPPFGGHVLSHDFVEAALIRRAGWSVTMLPTLPGSYEESPPSLIDVAVRDRRWAQGNLQHSGIIGAAGLRAASRQHFATGIAGYVASPLWLAQLVVGIALVLQTATIQPDYFSGDSGLFPNWPRFDPVRALQLFGLTMGILLAPKLLGLLLALFDGPVRRASGGALRLVLSSLIETLLSALIAPIAMLIQSGSVFQILAGRDTGWNPQRRDDGSIPFSDIVRRHRWHMALGLVTGVAAFAIATSLFLWMSPTILGLVLAIPISWASGQLAWGLGLKRLGLLMTPEERDPPAVATAAGSLARRNAAMGLDDAPALAAIHADAHLAAAHALMLPPASPRSRGAIDPDRTLAAAKLAEARTLDEATAWLSPKERLAVLHDRPLLDRLKSLS